jgi:HTH-type transcriptional regulator/antitoxin HigA
MSESGVVEAFPPGEFIQEELEARGWTQADLAYIMGRPPRLVNEVVTGKRGVTPQTAKELGDAFGTGAQFWLNLESSYRLFKLSQSGEGNGRVSRRAKLLSKAPINQIVRRNWIEGSNSLDVLESNVCEFLEIPTIEHTPTFQDHAARKSGSYGEITSGQLAWLFRAKHLAKAMDVSPFNRSQMSRVIDVVLSHAGNTEEVRYVPSVLNDAGIRFLVLEALPGTRIDGACFWLDQYSPVVALSLRYDRIDYFWHTLMHELGHIKRGDGIRNQFTALDVDLVGNKPVQVERKPKHEIAADALAVNWLVPQDKLESFIRRTRPRFSKAGIRRFAESNTVHPGIVVGQLQHRNEIAYSANREVLAKVRNDIIEVALTDGWGTTLPATT